MIRGIAILGLNGTGKSTLAHALAKQTGRFEMDVEDYYFPHQRASRISALEGGEVKPSEGIPFALSLSKDEVQRALIGDMDAHPEFVIAGVTMNWCDEILGRIDAAFLLSAPAEVRLERIRGREERRFGARVLPGGDMHAQQEQFRRMARGRNPKDAEESAARLGCPVIALDAQLPTEENLRTILEYLKKAR